MEGLLNSIKGMFIKEDGGVKWGTVIGIGVGALAGGFLLPMMNVLTAAPIVAAVVGSIGGLMVSQVVERFMPESEPAPSGAVAGATPAAQPHHGAGHAPEKPLHTPGVRNPRGTAGGKPR